MSEPPPQPTPDAGGSPKAPPEAAQQAADGTAGPELARAVLDAALAKRRDAQRAPRRRTGGEEGSVKLVDIAKGLAQARG